MTYFKIFLPIFFAGSMGLNTSCKTRTYAQNDKDSSSGKSILPEGESKNLVPLQGNVPIFSIDFSSKKYGYLQCYYKIKTFNFKKDEKNALDLENATSINTNYIIKDKFYEFIGNKKSGFALQKIGSDLKYAVGTALNSAFTVMIVPVTTMAGGIVGFASSISGNDFDLNGDIVQSDSKDSLGPIYGLGIGMVLGFKKPFELLNEGLREAKDPTNYFNVLAKEQKVGFTLSKNADVEMAKTSYFDGVTAVSEETLTVVESLVREADKQMTVNGSRCLSGNELANKPKAWWDRALKASQKLTSFR